MSVKISVSPPIPLWPTGQVPGAAGTHEEDIPAITRFRPEKPNGAAIVICPGGGYGMLAEHEREPVAQWAASLGILGVTLKYRLGPRYHQPVMGNDVARAIRTVRHHATEWGIFPSHIGVLGFSAGGHLASTAATHFDNGDPNARDPIERHSSRPDIAILLYPVITMESPATHLGSRTNLLGEHPDPALIAKFSNEKQVTALTPPTFLMHSSDDHAVPVENSLRFAAALSAAGVPFAMQIYEHGGHGCGLGGSDPVLSAWPVQCAAWMRHRGFF